MKTYQVKSNRLYWLNVPVRNSEPIERGALVEFKDDCYFRVATVVRDRALIDEARYDKIWVPTHPKNLVIGLDLVDPFED